MTVINLPVVCGRDVVVLGVVGVVIFVAVLVEVVVVVDVKDVISVEVAVDCVVTVDVRLEERVDLLITRYNILLWFLQ